MTTITQTFLFVCHDFLSSVIKVRECTLMISKWSRLFE